MNEWMTEDEAADWIGVPVRDLKEAVNPGELPVLRVGSSVRLSRTALVAHVGGNARNAVPILRLPLEPPAAVATIKDGRIPAPATLQWRSALTTAKPFEHHWPRRGGGSYVEQYPRAWSGNIILAGNDMSLLVGEATGAQRNDKVRRLTVLFDDYPMAEFAPTADGKGWSASSNRTGAHHRRD